MAFVERCARNLSQACLPTTSRINGTGSGIECWLIAFTVIWKMPAFDFLMPVPCVLHVQNLHDTRSEGAHGDESLGHVH